MPSRDIENMKKIKKRIQIKIPELQITMLEMKNPPHGIDSWLDIETEITDQLEDIAVEIVEHETKSKGIKV